MCFLDNCSFQINCKDKNKLRGSEGEGKSRVICSLYKFLSYHLIHAPQIIN